MDFFDFDRRVRDIPGLRTGTPDLRAASEVWPVPGFAAGPGMRLYLVRFGSLGNGRVQFLGVDGILLETDRFMKTYSFSDGFLVFEVRGSGDLVLADGSDRTWLFDVSDRCLLDLRLGLFDYMLARLSVTDD